MNRPISLFLSSRNCNGVARRAAAYSNVPIQEFNGRCLLLVMKVRGTQPKQLLKKLLDLL